MQETHRLFAELEATLTNGSGPQRFSILRRITDMFLTEVNTYSDNHVAVFDELMSCLIDRIEQEALVELSNKLAPVDRAPTNVIGVLSNHDDIEVAGPVLRRSPVLTDADLVTIATTKSQAHLSAIASRTAINEPVTDVLIDRGNSEVAHKVTANPRARLSRSGFSKAVKRAEGDFSLAVAVTARHDLPDDLLQQLVSRASITVRQRLLAHAGPQMRQRINHVLDTVMERVVREEVPVGVNMSPELRQDPAKLRARVVECAETRNVLELLDALAVLSDIPVKTIKDLGTQGSGEGILVLGKSCGFGWHDLHKIMAVLSPAKRTPDELNTLFTSYTALSVETAQRALGFIKSNRTKFANEMRKLAAAS